MSLGYAERLSFREDLGGRLGDPEILENSREVLKKLEQLTDLVGLSCRCYPPEVGPYALSLPGPPTQQHNNSTN